MMESIDILASFTAITRDTHAGATSDSRNVLSVERGVRRGPPLLNRIQRGARNICQVSHAAPHV